MWICNWVYTVLSGYQTCAFKMCYIAGADLAEERAAQTKQCVSLRHNTLFCSGHRCISPFRKPSDSGEDRGPHWSPAELLLSRPSCIYNRQSLSQDLLWVVGCGKHYVPCLHLQPLLWMCFFLFGVGRVISPSANCIRCFTAGFG